MEEHLLLKCGMQASLIEDKWNGLDFIFNSFAKNTCLVRQISPVRNNGRVEFDGFKEIPWDFKAHAMNTSRPQDHSS
ncbi:hypothetical protein CW696_07375 [ANME-2 cluster archaeon]|nr:MAG: hypothetical protein CW696_07375 [ANME-2 cluster archaeon]